MTDQVELVPAPELPPIRDGVPIQPDRHPVLIYLAGLAPGSRRTMREALQRVAARLSGAKWVQDARGRWALDGGALDALTLPWSNVRHQHVQAIRAELAARYAPASVNKTLAAIKGVLKECWRLELIDAETYHRAVDAKSVKGTRLLRGRALDIGEIRALADSCRKKTHPPVGMRDAALIGVLYCCGLRRGELVTLNMADYDPKTGGLKVRGKGNKERIVYTSNGSKDAVDAWMRERGDEPGPLFCPVNKGGNVSIRRMTEEAVFRILRRRAKDAGVKAFTPHDLRRTCASELWDAGIDAATIQRMLGHESQTTTARYDRRGERAKQQAAEALWFPF